MRVIYIPRSDATKVAGGDIIHIRQVQTEIRRLGVDFAIVPIQDLEHEKGADILHLTQIYETDIVERAVRWAEARRIPISISPLFEEGLAMAFRKAVRQQPKWQMVYRILGQRLAKSVYFSWQTANRPRNPEWGRSRAILQSAYLIPNTRYELNYIKGWFRLRNPRFSIVPLGIDPKVFNRQSGTDESLLPPVLTRHRGIYILQVGLISPRKNQDGLLRALSRADRVVVLLGRSSPYEPDYCTEVHRLADERGHVFFIDYAPENTLPVIYRQAAVHVLPSWSERPGVVSLEAAACGCKVVSSTHAPIHEYLGDRAWYCDPSSLESIRSALEQALEHPTPSDLEDHVLNHYTWANTALKLKLVWGTTMLGKASTPGHFSIPTDPAAQDCT